MHLILGEGGKSEGLESMVIAEGGNNNCHRKACNCLLPTDELPESAFSSASSPLFSTAGARVCAL